MNTTTAADHRVAVLRTYFLAVEADTLGIADDDLLTASLSADEIERVRSHVESLNLDATDVLRWIDANPTSVSTVLGTTATRTAVRSTARTSLRRVAGRTDAQVEQLVGAVVRHRLADGTPVRARITGRSHNPFYLAAVIVEGEFDGRIVRLNDTATVEL